MITETTQDIQIQNKLIDLRIREGEIIVTRLFDSYVHQPLVFFVLEKEAAPCVPSSVKKFKNVLHFDSEGGINGTITSGTYESINIEAQCEGKKIGIMWPTGENECSFGNDMYHIDKRFTVSANYKQVWDDPLVKNIYCPIVHMIKDACLTFTSNTDDPINFCYFYHNCKPYCNAIFQNKMNISFRSFTCKRASLSDYYQRHKYPRIVMDVKDIDPDQMKLILYNNYSLQNNIEQQYTLDTLTKIQKDLNTENIQNCVIGNVAMRFHGLNHSTIKDIDIVVSSVENAVNVLGSKNIQISENTKWSGCSARLEIFDENLHIDIVQMDNFDWNQVDTIKNIKVLSKNGLLLMKLIGEYERTLMQPNYDLFTSKNKRDISSLLVNSFVYPFFQNFLNQHSLENFDKIHMLIEGKEWDPVFITINDPLVVNVWRAKDSILISVINTGSPTDAKIHIGHPIKEALWHAIGEDPVECEIILHKEHAEIHIQNVTSMGVIECER